MSTWQRLLGLVAGLSAALGAVLVIPTAQTHIWLVAFGIAGALSLLRFFVPTRYWLDGALAAFGALTLLASLHEVAASLWLALVATWLFAWLFIDRMANAMAANFMSQDAAPAYGGSRTSSPGWCVQVASRLNGPRI